MRPRRTDADGPDAPCTDSRSAPGVSSAVWAAGLAPGSAAASWNAGALFTGASTLKLAILMCTFARDESDPVSERAVLDLPADDPRLVELRRRRGARRTSAGRPAAAARSSRSACAGSARRTRSCTAATRSTRSSRPSTTTTRPRSPTASTRPRTTSACCSSRSRRPRAARGRPTRIGLTGRKARVALWLLIHARYPGLVREATVAPVGHKAGWLGNLQHDAALVFTPKGTLVSRGHDRGIRRRLLHLEPQLRGSRDASRAEAPATELDRRAMAGRAKSL